LISARKEGQLINLTGVPTFIIEGKYKVVGAQTVEVFRDLLDKVDGGKS
jgi:predicted DsbA family dithiol-disulfide isomerase